MQRYGGKYDRDGVPDVHACLFQCVCGRPRLKSSPINQWDSFDTFVKLFPLSDSHNSFKGRIYVDALIIRPRPFN